MFCMKCGKRITEGSKFCTSCGTKAFDESNALQVVPQKDEGGEPPKKRKASLVVILSIFGVATAAAVALFLLLGRTAMPDVPYLVYLSEGELNFHDVRKDENETISGQIFGSAQTDREYYQYISIAMLSDDGKTLYYIDRIGENDTGALYRRDLSVNPERNQDLEKGERIAANVYAGGLSRARDDDTRIFYRKNYALQNAGYSGYYQYDLYMFADNEEILIARDVNSHWLSKDGSRLLYQASKEGGNGERTTSLYITNAVKDAEAARIDANIDRFVYGNDDLSVVYYIGERDGSTYLYLYTIDGERERLFKTGGEGVEEGDFTNSGAFVYLDVAPEGFQGSVYDYIHDEKAQDDAAIRSPEDTGGQTFSEQAELYAAKLHRDELRAALKGITFDRLREENAPLARFLSPSILYRLSPNGDTTQIAQFPAYMLYGSNAGSSSIGASDHNGIGGSFVLIDQESLGQESILSSLNSILESMPYYVYSGDYYDAYSQTFDAEGLTGAYKKALSDIPDLGSYIYASALGLDLGSTEFSVRNVRIQDDAVIVADGHFLWEASVVHNNKLFAIETVVEALADADAIGQLVSYDIENGVVVNRKVVTSDATAMASPLDENGRARGYFYFMKDTGNASSGDLFRCDAASGEYQRIAVDVYYSVSYHTKTDTMYYLADYADDIGTLYRCGKSGEPERIANELYIDSGSYGVLRDGSVAYISDRSSTGMRHGDLWRYESADKKTRIALDVSNFYGMDPIVYYYLD